VEDAAVFDDDMELLAVQTKDSHFNTPPYKSTNCNRKLFFKNPKKPKIKINYNEADAHIKIQRHQIFIMVPS